MLADPISTGPVADDPTPLTEPKDPELPWFRINWEIKALVPIACVLLGGMLLFLLATLSWRDPERHIVLLVAGAGAVAICGALLVVLTYTVQRPMVELQQKIAQLGGGDLSVSVSFAHRNDEIGDLGRNFNQMVAQLRESRDEIERLHRTQMSRAEHLATLGEMATGLAHEIRNPAGGNCRRHRNHRPRSAFHQPGTLRRQRRSPGNRPHQSHRHRPAADGPPASAQGPQERSEHHGRTRGHARPPAGAGEIDRDRAAQRSYRCQKSSTTAIRFTRCCSTCCSMPCRPSTRTERSSVTVRVARDNAAIVEVTDNGRGIAPDQLPNIFRPFYTTKGDGTGLGLSLARRIVEDHQGRIDVTSTVGKGTTFAVVLPLQRAEASNAAS